MESLGRDAGHGERMAVEPQRPTGDGRILVEATLPETVAQHHDRRGARLLAIPRREEPARGRMGAEHGEVVGGHQAAGDDFPAAVVSRAPHAQRRPEHLRCVHAVERRRALADVEVVGIRAGVEPDALPADADVVRHRKDGGVGADADGERQHSGEGEERVAPEQPHRVPQVPPRVVEPDERALVAVKLLHLLDAAQREPRRPSRLLRRQAAAQKLVFEEREVRRQLAREVGLRAPGAQQVDQLREQSPEARHQSDSFRRSLSTRPANRRHLSVCSPSARAPAFVIA